MDELDYKSLSTGFVLKGKRPEAIFMIHGFCTTALNLYPMADYLHRLGYTVIAVTLQGHENQDIEELKKSTYKGWISKAKASYLSALSQYPKTYLLGYSLGGAIACQLAKENPCSGLILVEPGLRLQAPFASLARLIPWKKVQFKDFALDSEMERYFARTSGFYYKNVKDLLKCGRLARKSAKSQKQPIFMTYAGLDKDVCEKDMKKFLENSKRKDNVFKVYPNSTHLLPLEPDYTRLCEDIDRFIEGTQKREQS